VVIGSGATAATLIPAIARDCAHLTMLQRSPTYFRIGRNAIEIADELRRLQVDPAWIHEIVRRKIIFEGAAFSKRCLAEPETVKQELLAATSSSTSRRATVRGNSASPSSRTAICSRPSPRVKLPW
jgi:cation diffusion facilitator CzcD-associated flavoprotein CzcO